MIDFIINIFDQLVDLYQHLFGVPEGVTYALFGSRKKKKAKKKLAAATTQIDSALGDDAGNINDSIPNDIEGGFESTELVTEGEPTPGKDSPDVPFKPSFPYSGRQIIIDSGRLHLNAKDDFILLMSKKSISLSAQGSVNIDSDNTVIINAKKIKLGIGDQSNHPLVLGDNLNTLLFQMATFLQKTADGLKDSEDSIGGIIAENNTASKNLAQMAKVILSNLDTITSKKNFTQ